MSRSFSLWTRRTAAAWGKNPLLYRFPEKALCNKIAALFSKDDAMCQNVRLFWRTPCFFDDLVFEYSMDLFAKVLFYSLVKHEFGHTLVDWK